MKTIKIKTAVLSNLVNKAIKGNSNNKMIPLTSLMHVVLKDNVLKITTTDATTFLTVMADKIEGEDFSVVLKSDIFCKLVSKTTTETITLKLENDYLTFVGNGSYKIALQLNEDGEPINYPNYYINTNSNPEIPTYTGTIPLTTIKSIYAYNKPCLALTLEMPCLTGYLFSNGKVITADSFNMCINTVPTIEPRLLLPANLIDMLVLNTAENINYTIKGNKLMFVTSNMIVYSVAMDGIDTYPEDKINEINIQLESKCTISKTAILNVLDRLSLFISDHDVNGVYLTFTEQGIKVDSSKNNATELIPYVDSKNFKSFTCMVGVESFKKQISARTSDTVELWYGDNDVITMTDNNINQVIALLQDDRFEEEEE